MKIYLNQIGKRYQRHWIFKSITYTFEPGLRYAILGNNGSGKSTLLRIIAGMQQTNKGSVTYDPGTGKDMIPEKIFTHISYCAPGMELIEEMSLKELLHFHFTFKPILPGHSINSILDELGMRHISTQFIHEFSSGMKQRVKLAQAFFTDTPVLLLDEPCSNLDAQGVALYQAWLRKYAADRLVIIASNDEREYEGVHDSFKIPNLSK